MSNIGEERCTQILEYAKDFGDDEACIRFEIKPSTLERYRRADKQPTREPKILLFDIETAPIEVYVWQLKNNNYIHIGQIIDIAKDWNIICWRAKWLCADEILGAVQTPEEAIKRDDKRIVKELWKLIDEADILIGHNVDNFDKKKANSRFLVHGLKPPSPYQTIDTLKVARKQFNMTSNKLDYLCQKLGIGAKLDTGFNLWRRCLRGDEEALQQMYDYCGQDTSILEDLYIKLRGWITSHPNIALYLDSDEELCASCGSENIKLDSKYYYTPTGKYRTFVCKDCGARSRVRYTGKKNKFMLRSVAR